MERQGLYQKYQGMVTEAGCQAAKKESAASIILSMLEGTAGRAEKLASIVLERTNSVTRNEPPSVQEVNKNSTAQVSFPPLFERIRELTASINCSLSGIEDVMRRLEL